MSEVRTGCVFGVHEYRFHWIQGSLDTGFTGSLCFLLFNPAVASQGDLQPS
jgi:hypothetical protein